MNKFIKLGKRILALFIVVLLNVNTYAAVGANDGSAFVTKAEFDALVNTFNEQMDTYQSGLNSKIDGAIANYLAGLSSVQRVDVEPINKNAVWSVSNTSDIHDWVEGTINCSWSSYIARTSDTTGNTTGANTGSLKTTGGMGTREYFNEHLIDNANIYNSYCKYKGYNKSYISATLYGEDFRANNMWVKYTGSSMIRALTFFVGSDSLMQFESKRDGGGSNINTLREGLFSRMTDEVYFADVVCTPAGGLEYNRFNPNDLTDGMSYWCKDPDVANNGMHNFARASEVLTNITGEVTSASYSGSTNFVWESNYEWQDNASSVRLSGNMLQGCKPFVGFSDVIDNWKWLYVGTYDEIIGELESKGKAHVATDAQGKKHLLVTNGLPILKANAGDVVHMPLKFDKIDDEYKNIDIWLKASAFKLDENVKTTTDADMIKAENEDKMIPSAYSNAITLDAINGKGEGILKFKMPKDGYVFMKWSVAGNEAAGGGVFHPQTMSVELAE